MVTAGTVTAPKKICPTASVQTDIRDDIVTDKKKVLFLCTHNSCRSQMAEGIVNHCFGNRLRAFSAGTEATAVNPRAVKVMQEIGIDISGHRSKTMDKFAGEKFDYVITLCGDANEKCPLFFGGVERMHMSFSDPAKAAGTEEEIMAEFRRVRDEIRQRLAEFLKSR
jgi:arsenate reductase (thioredoxin)